MQVLVVVVGVALLIIGIGLLLFPKAAAPPSTTTKAVGIHFTGPPGLVLVGLGVFVILFPVSPWWPGDDDATDRSDSSPDTSVGTGDEASAEDAISMPASSTESPSPEIDSGSATATSGNREDRSEGGTQWREFEDGELVAPMQAVTDLSANNGEFVESPIDAQGEVSIDLDIAEDGSYVLWARVKCADPCVNHNSVFVTLDGARTDTWDFFEDEPDPASDEWRWERISLRDGGTFENHLANPWTPELVQGPHRLEFKAREAGAALDVLVVTDDPDFEP